MCDFFNLSKIVVKSYDICLLYGAMTQLGVQVTWMPPKGGHQLK